MDTNDEKIYTIAEVVPILKIGEPAIRRRIAEKKLKAYLEGNKYVITQASLDEYLREKQDETLMRFGEQKLHSEWQASLDPSTRVYSNPSPVGSSWLMEIQLIEKLDLIAEKIDLIINDMNIREYYHDHGKVETEIKKTQ